MPAPEEKPTDWIYNAVPRSKRESAAKSAEARVTETVKNALVSYLGRYLNSDGIHRQLLNLTAEFSVQFDTRLSGPKDPDDPSVYEVQLARFWSELRQKLPCILITDTGFTYKPTGIGGLTNSFRVNSNTSAVQLAMLAEIPIDLHIAALDETTCGDIRDILVYVLGPLTSFTKGHIITSTRPEDKWEIRLPITFEPSGLTHKNITQDTKDQMWTTTVSLKATFEGLVNIGFDNQLHQDLIQGIDPNVDRVPLTFDGTGRLVPREIAPSIDTTITVPSTITLHQNAPIEAEWLPSNSYFISTDPKIALIDSATCVIIPKRIGSFQLKLMQRTPERSGGPNTLFTWDVKVTFT